MGWAFYENSEGRPCGYGVEARCDEPGCDAEIHRGLAYLCGTVSTIDGDDGPGCGGYFCEKHLCFAGRMKSGGYVSLCRACLDDPETMAEIEKEN